MTEFRLEGAVLGLMPGAGVRRLLGERLPDPSPPTPRGSAAFLRCVVRWFRQDRNLTAAERVDAILSHSHPG
jgi:hypothetical protein